MIQSQKRPDESPPLKGDRGAKQRRDSSRSASAAGGCSIDAGTSPALAPLGHPLQRGTSRFLTSYRRIIPYDPALKPLARALRKNGTLAEVLLWQHLRRKQIRGYSFYRQRPIDRYIVDFFCPELMLAIEVDGSSHDQKGAEDLTRQTRLEALGVRFLRFEDREVRRTTNEVLFTIGQWVAEAEEVEP